MVAIRSAECLNEREEGGWFMLLQMWEPDDDEDAFAMASCINLLQEGLSMCLEDLLRER